MASTVVAGPELTATLSRLTFGDMFDTVFDATESLPAIAQSLSYVAHGGALVLVGVANGDLVYADPNSTSGKLP